MEQGQSILLLDIFCLMFDNLLQVFEDPSEGIICYTDENGETICEGYDDEDPRYHQKVHTSGSNLRWITFNMF